LSHRKSGKDVLGLKYYTDVVDEGVYNQGPGSNMAKITKSIRLGLTPNLLEEARTGARQQKISVNALIRAALQQYLNELNQKRVESSRAEKPKGIRLLDMPLVSWTQAEKEFADRVIKKHFEEDR
jgi:hypothetical protein